MENINVRKDKLIETMQANRDAHRGEFLEAQKKYREKAIEALDRQIALAKAGDKFDLGFSLPIPQDYTKSYNSAIAMLEWEISDEIELDERDFKRYVLNDWEWAAAFAGSTQIYNAK